MNFLGINGGPNLVFNNIFNVKETWHHDSGATLVRNGRVLAAFEEERLNRIKHTNKFPILSIRACLANKKLNNSNLCVAFSSSENQLKETLPFYFSDTLSAVDPKQFLRNLLATHTGLEIDAANIELIEHHYAHAASAFFTSSFEEALVLTIDAAGDGISGSVYVGAGNRLIFLRSYNVSQSLGDFYTIGTQLLGFNHFDEFKVMGLAPYGDKNSYASQFEACYDLMPNGQYALHLDNLKALASSVLGSKRDEFHRQTHKDFAAGLQGALETITFHVLHHFQRLVKMDNLCLAGGVALNCTLNGKIAKRKMFKNVFIFPASSDSGLATGSALGAQFRRCSATTRRPLTSLFLGTQIPNRDYIAHELSNWTKFLNFRFVSNICKHAAELLAGNNVIGWFQGRSEFGPRALGNRSILADARPSANKERINSMIKKRESFRPFAPAVLKEYAGQYFELPDEKIDFSHMTYSVQVNSNYISLLGATTHFDASARLQTVDSHTNHRFWQLIRSFYELTGVPVVLNTSFNNNWEPIVDTTTDAIVCFLTTNIDFLAVGDFIVSKKMYGIDTLCDLFPQIPAHIYIKDCSHGLEAACSSCFFLANSYNDNKISISTDLYSILSRINGMVKLQDILSGCQVENRNQILAEITGLWEKRVLKLSPVPYLAH